MYCKNCGTELREDALYCNHCGESVTVTPEVVSGMKETPKVWDVFSKIGFIGGIICFICSFIPILNIMACSFGIPFIVLSALGKKTSNLVNYQKAAKGLKFSIAATIIGFVTWIIFVVFMELALMLY